jgi:hypothetical protein
MRRIIVDIYSHPDHPEYRNYSIRVGEKFQNQLCLDEVVGHLAIMLIKDSESGLKTMDEHVSIGF